MVLLRVQDLTVSYTASDRSLLMALQGVSFEMAFGEALGLLGESGCGKTTLALSLVNLLPSSALIQRGSIAFCGANLLEISEHEMRKLRGSQISMVHQEPALALNPVIRVGDQISEVLRAHQPVSRHYARDEAKSLLVQMGFSPESRIWEAYPHQLSGGQQQRVAIAQAIACRPALVIADEPTTALDSDTQVEIIDVLRRLKEQFRLAVILISHDPELLARFADRILVMYAGRVVEEGPAEQVLTQPLHPYTQALLRCRPTGLPRNGHRQPWPTIPGDPPNLACLFPGCSFATRCLDRMDICGTSPPAPFPSGVNRQVTCFKYAP
jgi:oligopeptide/dipeptide ABC transporter ATP-binding protein